MSISDNNVAPKAGVGHNSNYSVVFNFYVFINKINTVGWLASL